jgi:hypothetical protein
MPRILVVLYVPEECERWMEISQERAILKHAAWWMNLQNTPATENKTSITLKIPRVNLFTPAILTDFLDQTRKKFAPL